MRAGQLSLDEQMTCLREALDRNRTLSAVLSGAAAMNLPDWYLVAGWLYQTVWNVITGQPPEAGILDYDLVYFDASDLSWEAAIDAFEATVASLGVRLEPAGRWRVYAPYGLSDVFNMVIRPNPVLATRDVYETKTARWQGQWPGLTVLRWRVLPVIAGRATAMPDNDDRTWRRLGRPRQAGAWVGAVGIYAAAQGLSAWAGQHEAGRGTRPQYSQFERPAFAPPGAVFPLAWSALNLTTASSAWLIWRAPDPATTAPRRGEALAWWAAAVVIRSGYVPLAFERRRLWAATADAALLCAAMTRYAFLARKVDQTAALLAVPEVAWTAFATALSAAIAAKNP